MQFNASTTAVALLWAALALTTGMNAGVAQATSLLPGGASSLQETYDDWRVTCANQAAATVPACAVSQTQSRSNGKRLFSLELMGSLDDGLVKGNLVLPFGLRLASGVAWQVNDGAKGEGFPFSKCLPSGCIVPLSLDEKTVELLKNGTVLNIHAQASANEQPVELKVSLKGFSAAINRAGELASMKK